MKTLTFDGKQSSAYYIYISGEGVYNAPERIVEMVSVPGRNGSLAMDEGRFADIDITYPAGTFGTDQPDFATKVAAFRNILVSRHSFVRLTDDYHTDEYRLALYKSGLEVIPVNYGTAGEFNITFTAKPQRFLTSGESVTTLTTSGTITNPTEFDSQPLLTATGNGTLTVNGVAITIGGTSNTVIDCELMEAYDGVNSKNGDILLSPNRFPVLSSGANTITLSAGITKVEIIPRWWRI